MRIRNISGSFLKRIMTAPAASERKVLTPKVMVVMVAVVVVVMMMVAVVVMVVLVLVAVIVVIVVVVVVMVIVHASCRLSRSAQMNG